MIPTPLADTLSAYRLTRFVTADVILDGPRDDVVRWAYKRHPELAHPDLYPPYANVRPGQWAEYAMEDDDAPKLASLVTCRFCAGMWVSLFVVAARRYAPRLWDPLAQALAMSAGAALLARLED